MIGNQVFHRLLLAAPAALMLMAAGPAGSADRHTIWLDAYSGEPVLYDEMLDELAQARIVYLGEIHTIRRHHVWQQRIVESLAGRGKKLLLGIEQMEAFNQPELDRYNRGEASFDELARRTDWARRWANFRDYAGVIGAAHRLGAPVIALNARAETIREVGRRGLAGLAPEQRRELPPEMSLDDPPYQKLLGLRLQVHAMMPPERLRAVFEAQVARDEEMAAVLSSALEGAEGKGRLAVVLCGAGHVSYGLGIPTRVRRRLPEATDRIVLFSESGDLVLSAKEKAMAREVRTTHDDLRFLPAPVADYLNVMELRRSAPARLGRAGTKAP
jgi:uncharacterized iron-regulated protein